jgi:hypothetical protein
MCSGSGGAVRGCALVNTGVVHAKFDPPVAAQRVCVVPSRTAALGKAWGQSTHRKQPLLGAGPQGKPVVLGATMTASQHQCQRSSTRCRLLRRVLLWNDESNVGCARHALGRVLLWHDKMFPTWEVQGMPWNVSVQCCMATCARHTPGWKVARIEVACIKAGIEAVLACHVLAITSASAGGGRAPQSAREGPRHPLPPEQLLCVVHHWHRQRPTA